MAFGALLAGGLSLLAGNKAAKATSRASGEATAENRRQFDLGREDTREAREAGDKARAQLGEHIYDEDYYRGDAEEIMAKEPGYQFTLGEGEKAIERAGSASGRRLSPATVKELQRYGTGLASQTYGSAYNRFMGEKDKYLSNLYKMTGLGDTATTQAVAAGGQQSSNLQNIMLAQGKNQAANYANYNAALQGTLKNYQTLDSYNKALDYSGGGGAGVASGGP